MSEIRRIDLNAPTETSVSSQEAAVLQEQADKPVVVETYDSIDAMPDPVMKTPTEVLPTSPEKVRKGAYESEAHYDQELRNRADILLDVIVQKFAQADEAEGAHVNDIVLQKDGHRIGRSYQTKEQIGTENSQLNGEPLLDPNEVNLGNRYSVSREPTNEKNPDGSVKYNYKLSWIVSSTGDELVMRETNFGEDAPSRPFVEKKMQRVTNEKGETSYVQVGNAKDGKPDFMIGGGVEGVEIAEGDVDGVKYFDEVARHLDAAAP